MISEAIDADVDGLPSSAIELGSRIASIVAQFPTQELAASSAGISVGTLVNYMAGRTKPSLIAVAAMAREAGVSMDWVCNGETSKAGVPVPSIQQDFVLLPRYDIQASAGGGRLIHSESIVDFLAFRVDWVRRTLAINPKDLALISATGDSMQPGIHDGDLLLLDITIDRVKDNAIYVIQLDGELLVKRLQRRMNGSLQVISDNPIYSPEEIPAHEIDKLHVVGRVIWHGGLT